MPRFSHTAPELRAAIADLLSEELGQFANGQPSIWVEPSSTPKGTINGGLEVSISRFENISSSQLLFNSQQFERYEWLVVVKTIGDRTQQEYSKFTSAINKMRLYFPRRRETISPYDEFQIMQASFRLSEVRINNNYV